MNKEYLKKAQPIVYQTLSNALKNKKVANAYLFHGPKGSSKLETAILFAQVLCANIQILMVLRVKNVKAVSG
jgi:DNA polymerase-3 subunit delta'